MNKYLEILIGIILLVVPIAEWVGNYTGLNFGTAALEVLKGGLVWLVILIGLIFLILGISELKDSD
jgi:hypothetical protein